MTDVTMTMVRARLQGERERLAKGAITREEYAAGFMVARAIARLIRESAASAKADQ